MFIIYKLTAPSGKCYIGLTGGTFTQRWNSHMFDFRSGRGGCKKLYNAFRKYPPELWYRQVLLTNLSKEEAELKEIEIIKFYNSIDDGYNILLGGGLARTGMTNSDEHKQKCSKALKGLKRAPRPESWSKHISETHKKNKHTPPSRKGIPFTEEQKAKLRGRKLSEEVLAKRRGRKRSEETKLKIKTTLLALHKAKKELKNSRQDVAA